MTEPGDASAEVTNETESLDVGPPVGEVPVRPEVADMAAAPSLDVGPHVGEAPVRPEVPAEVPEGEWLVKLSWLGSVAFAVTAAAAAAFPEPLVYISVPLAIGLFAVGVVVFLWAYVVAISRSRTDLIGIGGLYFLVGCAPRRVRNQMLWSFGVQVVVALVTASLRPYTPLAFGILVPTYGLGLAGLWGARYGVFPSRPDLSTADPPET
ncbi:MAG: hypothetical protein N2037_05675 [Acidimicrobiales bacterium]|nr:hypothetical protein [Acidimicrobiales bacterium]